MGVIVISLKTPESTRENIGCTWEHLGAPATSLGTPMTCLRALTTSLEAPTTCFKAPTTSLGSPWSTSDHCKTVSENYIFFGNIAGVLVNHSYYLSFNNFQNSCIQFLFSSIYLYTYLSTQSISELVADSIWERFEECLKMMIEWAWRYTRRPWSSEFGDAFWGVNGGYLEIHLEAVIKCYQRCTPTCWSTKIGDSVGVDERANCQAAIVQAGRYRCWPWSCEVAYCNRASVEIHLEAIIEKVWRCTWRQ